MKIYASVDQIDIQRRWWCPWFLAESNFNILSPWQKDRDFPNAIIKCILMNENVQIAIKISLQFVSY